MSARSSALAAAEQGFRPLLTIEKIFNMMGTVPTPSIPLIALFAVVARVLGRRRLRIIVEPPTNPTEFS